MTRSSRRRIRTRKKATRPTLPEPGDAGQVKGTVTRGTARFRPETGLLWLAGFLILLGVVVYAVDRGGQVYFLPSWLAYGAAHSVFGPLGGHLPSFVHTLAFIAITAAALWPCSA